MKRILCCFAPLILAVVLVGCGAGGGQRQSASVTITPNSVALAPGESQSLTAFVPGATNQAVTWAVVEQGGGTFPVDGQYSAPNSEGTFHIKAASVANPSMSTTIQAVVKLPSISVTPAATSVATNGMQAFTAAVTGTKSPAVTWSTVEPNGGTITAAGAYTAPGSSGTFHVKATVTAYPTQTATAVVTVTAGPVVTVTVSPKTATVPAGGSQSFAVTVTGSSNIAVNWSVVEADGGSISASGNYSAPFTGGTYHIRATSVADNTKTDTATVTVTAPQPVTIAPGQATLAPEASKAFTASSAVTWKVVEVGGGSVTAAGIYTAPSVPGNYTIKATSTSNPASSGTATVTVLAKPVVVSSFSDAKYTPGTALTITLDSAPAGTEAAYAVEDTPPTGWTVDLTSISDGGTFDGSTGKVKFGPFFDSTRRSLTYRVIPVGSGTAAFVGTAAFDNVNSPIIGDRTISN